MMSTRLDIKLTGNDEYINKHIYICTHPGVCVDTFTRNSERPCIYVMYSLTKR